MFLQIFHIRKTINDIKDAHANPAGFAVGQGKELFMGAALPLLLPVIVFTSLVGIFAFSSFLGGPYLLGKIVFWIVILPSILSILVIKKLYSLIFFEKKHPKNPEVKVVATYDQEGKRID